jgi:hypothetical protein
MSLNDEQKKTVSGWIASGMKLSEIQKLLETEFGLRMTYLEVRLLVDELRLTPKDPEPAPAARKESPLAAPQAKPKGPPLKPGAQPEPPVPAGGVSVSVDRVARPGALISGKVTFSDGKSAEWHLDQFGRLGLVPQEQGYRPTAADLQTFQNELQAELQGMGL